MELKIPSAELNKALYRTQGIVDRKTTMPILSNVLLDARKDLGLTVSAFDTEIGLVGHYPCEVRTEGAVALPSRHLYDIVHSLPEESVLALKQLPNGQVELQTGSVRFKIVSSPAGEFPALPTAEGAVGLTISADLLSLMIERTAFAISTDETRYNLGGVFLERTDEDSLRMVATDGHRLSLIDRPVAGTAAIERGVLIPKKGLQELRRLLSEEGGECELGFTKGSAVFKRDGLVMVMRLLEGQFPDYRQVIPRESAKVVRLGRTLFIDALRRVSLVASDKTNGVRLEISPGKLILGSQNPDLGEAQEEIEAEVTGEDLKIGFNARYLIDALSVLSSDEVRLELADELSPGVLRPVGEEGGLAVVMPMRI